MEYSGHRIVFIYFPAEEAAQRAEQNSTNSESQESSLPMPQPSSAGPQLNPEVPTAQVPMDERPAYSPMSPNRKNIFHSVLKYK